MSTEETTRECEGTALHDLIAELEAAGWRVVSISKLPAALGYRVRAVRSTT